MKRRNLLTRGNGKLGEGIHAWTIPAVETCPGRSTLCERVCYARAGRFRTHLLQDRLAENLDIALADDFIHRIVTEVRRRGVHTLRIHVSGDFFSAAYAWQWASIARRSLHTTFFAYTRSWRVPEIAPALEELARLCNVRLWYSCDAETGLPEQIAPCIRLAYLQTAAADTPAGDLVFRIESLRATPTRRIGLSVVCPRETGHAHATAVTCTSCRKLPRIMPSAACCQYASHQPSKGSR